MFSLLHRVISATGFLFVATFPVTGFLIFFLTGMSTDSGVEGAIYFVAILPFIHLFFTLLFYGTTLLLRHIFKEGLKKEQIEAFWRKHMGLILIGFAVLMLFGGQPIIFIGGVIAFVYWLTEKMKRWHGFLLVFFSLVPYGGFLFWYLIVCTWD